MIIDSISRVELSNLEIAEANSFTKQRKNKPENGRSNVFAQLERHFGIVRIH